MSTEQEPPETSSEIEAGPPGKTYSRRRLITSVSAAAGVAAVAGVAGGVALVQGGQPTPSIQPSASRRFVDKVVVVTGATSGIGKAAAIQFAHEGGKVGFCGRRKDLGAQVEQEIRAAGGEATYIKADVRDPREVQSFVDRVADRYGGLDVCFNNAGITVQKKLHEYTEQEWDDVVNTSLRGNFLTLKAEIPHLVKRGGGVVVITSSAVAISAGPSQAAYSAAKAGLLGLAKSASLDYAGDGIRINTLLPGTTNTELVRRVAGTENLPDAAWDAMTKVWAKANMTGQQRMATAEEIAAFAVTLASGDFPFMTGSQMSIDGGIGAYG
nr:SDR family NAD(P)-dependent oxidoreductase [Kibdelosporangium sp. MJ126-NF4]CEL21031.1 oxidoreductase ucpA [Kibdelosporangium sp. MJ126-NF4]CTQ95455.1 oxidoreductase ucpA [Kibdelosporangium sp. MJ126-NF4]